MSGIFKNMLFSIILVMMLFSASHQNLPKTQWMDGDGDSFGGQVEISTTATKEECVKAVHQKNLDSSKDLAACKLKVTRSCKSDVKYNGATWVKSNQKCYGEQAWFGVKESSDHMTTSFLGQATTLNTASEKTVAYAIGSSSDPKKYTRIGDLVQCQSRRYCSLAQTKKELTVDECAQFCSRRSKIFQSCTAVKKKCDCCCMLSSSYETGTCVSDMISRNNQFEGQSYDLYSMWRGKGGTRVQNFYNVYKFDDITCTPNPCKNGGVCEVGPPGHIHCKCDQTKWSGKHCEIEAMDTCAKTGTETAETSVIKSDYEIVWHPKYKCPDPSKVPQDENWCSTAVQWEIPYAEEEGPRPRDLDNHPSIEADSRTQQYLMFSVRHKTTKKVVDFDYEKPFRKYLTSFANDGKLKIEIVPTCKNKDKNNNDKDYTVCNRDYVPTDQNQQNLVVQGSDFGYYKSEWLDQYRSKTGMSPDGKCRKASNGEAFDGNSDPDKFIGKGLMWGVWWARTHSHHGVPGERKWRITYTPDPSKPDVYSSIDSHPFNVKSRDHITHHLRFAEEPPRVVTANNPFKLKIKVHNENLQDIVSGLASRNMIRIEGISTYKYSYDMEKYVDITQSPYYIWDLSMTRIGGPDGRIDKSTNDSIALKQMKNGMVTFDIALENVSPQSVAQYLNISVVTSGMHNTLVKDYFSGGSCALPYGECLKGNWSAYMHDTGDTSAQSDDNVNGYDTKHLKKNGIDVVHIDKNCEKTCYGKECWSSQTCDDNCDTCDRYSGGPRRGNHELPYPRPTGASEIGKMEEHVLGRLYPKFIVIAQTPGKLQFVTDKIASSQSANMIIEGIQMELVDVNGYRITSGPDSSLKVTATTDNVNCKAAVDSEMTMKRGFADFTGSVTSACTDVTLMFSVTTSAGKLDSAKSQKFTVTNALKIAEFSSSSKEKTWKEQALTKVKTEFLKSRTLTMVSIPNDANPLLQNAMDVFELNNNQIAGISASASSEENLNIFTGLAGFYRTSVVTYDDDTARGSAWPKYQDVVRMKHNAMYFYHVIAKFMQARLWDRVVVITEENSEDASTFEMETMFTKHNIKVVEFKYPSAVDKVATEAFFKQITDTGYNVILPLVKNSNMNKLVSEAIENKLAPADGVQWLRIEEPESGLTQEVISKMNGAFSFSIDHSKDLTLTDATSKDELIYDSVYLIAAALDALIKESKTITRVNMRAALRNVKVSGKSGPMNFAQNGDRIGMKVILNQIQGGALKHVRTLSIKSGAGLGDQLNSKWIKGASIDEKAIAKVNYISSDSKAFNNIALQIDGKSAIEEVPSTEKWCNGGCGGNMLASDSRYWSRGSCKTGKCICKINPSTNMPAFAGQNCEVINCGVCNFGKCTEHNGIPRCSCDGTGYHDKINGTTKSVMERCSVPQCHGSLSLKNKQDKYGCNYQSATINRHGKCMKPDECVCDSGFYGKWCERKCGQCIHGSCSDGAQGTGACNCDSGYIGDKCDTPLAGVILGAILGGLFVAFVVAMSVRALIRHARIQAALHSMDWKVEWADIRMRQKKNRSSVKSIVSMVSMKSMATSRMSARSGVSAKSGRDRVICQNQGNWNGKEIVIKTLEKDTVALTDIIRKEIRQMREITHMNLCAFIGAVIESPNVAVLNEICGKGSLEDVLMNEKFDLDWNFKFSILKDIVRGMQYLHQTSIGSHGRLKSSNCLIDTRWSVKIADYGMKEFKANQNGVRIFNPGKFIGVELPTEEELINCDYYGCLWTSPEIIETGVSHPNHVGYGTREGDIYSFGIIMTEVATHNHPFSDLEHLGPEEIVPIIGGLIPMDKTLPSTQYENRHGKIVDTLRPTMPVNKLPDTCAEEFVKLFHACCEENPLKRPVFKDIMKNLNKMSPHRGELMDNLVDLMEHYTRSLEMIITDRTADLTAEKEANEALLDKMLPPLIAAELKLGRNPPPEFFNMVTIQFSDVVGFGKICNESSPIQVVELLNHLYDIMDDTIDLFSCYKVETIADSYVVASGIPTRSEDHAEQIGALALTLLHNINDVGYKHLPNTQVQLRIGINSGPIVGGVVGLRMPRYCLFGDTMNTASRMESGGYALKIHISAAAHKLMEEAGGFQFICRGEREIKGKGIMKTYWLVGRDNMNLVLPTEDKAASLSLHHFK